MCLCVFRWVSQIERHRNREKGHTFGDKRKGVVLMEALCTTCSKIFWDQIYNFTFKVSPIFKLARSKIN